MSYLAPGVLPAIAPPALKPRTIRRISLLLALTLSQIIACDTDPPLINTLVNETPGPATQEWLDTVFLQENPNAAEYRLIEVNSRQFLNDVERVRLTLLNGEVVTAIRRSSEVYDESIVWAGVVEGIAESDVEVRATNNPNLMGHVVIDERVELFERAVPGATGIIYRVDTPARAFSHRADIFPDADAAEIGGVAWRALVDKLPASAYRLVTLNVDVWRRKIDEFDEAGAVEMRFFDDTLLRVVASKRGGYPQIDGDEFSSVSLRYVGGTAGMRGGVRSRETGMIRVTPINETGFYVIWRMHPDFRKRID